MAKGGNGGWNSERSAAGPNGNPWLLTGVISIATFMTTLDTSIANVALPYIAGGLSVSQEQATWVLTSFLAAQAIVIPISGWLTDVIGRKRYYMISVVIFTAASAACAFSPSIAFLVIARIIQGAAAGGLAPSEQSMLADSFPPSQRGLAFAAYGVVVVVGPVLGPTIGGYLTDTASWHWIFIINVPIGIISLLLVYNVVIEPEVMEKERQERLDEGISVDYVGFILVALGLGCLTVGLERGQQDNWFASSFITTMLGLSAFSLIGLIVWELNHRNPIVRLKLLGNRNFAVVCAIMFLVGMILFGTTQIIPQMFQEVYGYTAFKAGLALTLGGVAILMAMPFAGRLSGNVDARLLIMPALAVSAFGVWHFTRLTLEADFWHLSVARFIQTIGLPFLFVPISTIAYIGLRADQTNDASALLNVARYLGGSVGISFSQTILAQRAQFHQSRLVEILNPLNPNYQDAIARMGGLARQAGEQMLPQAMIFQQVTHNARFLSYNDAFRAITWLIVIALPFAFLIRGSEASDAEGAPAA